MKTNLLNSALALAALCSVVTLKAATLSSVGEIPLSQVAAVTAANGDTVTPGTARIMVSMRLGSPNTVLADGSWLYSDYTASIGANDSIQHGTLVVRFKDNKVTHLSLADRVTTVALRHSPRPTVKDKVFAVADKRR